MAILFITHKFPPGIGGMEKQSYELINGLRKHAKVYTIIQSPTESKLIFFLKLQRRVKNMLSLHQDITAIHCNDSVMASACIWIKEKYSIPVTATFHGLDIVFPNVLFQKYIVPKLRNLDRVFAVSTATRVECIKRGFRKDQVVEICNGVGHELSTLRIESDFEARFQSEYGFNLKGKKILLSIGRSVQRKGFSWFAKNVMPLLPSDVHYLIVGPRSNTKSIMNRVLQLLPRKIKSHIELFLGHPSDDKELDLVLSDPTHRSFHMGVMPSENLRQLTSYASLLLMPNVQVDGDMEGFGLVGLEANLCGTYVAAAELEGITSAINHNKNGVLIPSEEAESWSKEINSLLESPNTLNEKEAEASEFVMRRFSWEKMAQLYFSEFEKIASTYQYVELNNEVMLA